VRDTLESEFITMWSGLVCPETLTVTYTAAGHDPALLFSLRNARAEVRELTTYDMALAIDPGQQYHVGREKLTPGDVLVVYTDGLTDAADFASNRFTRTRVIEAVALLMQNKPDATASEIVEKLMWTIRQFAGVRVANDDITLVVLRVK
jgi:sigma-B regulation protein RsbU (phosphoserine phosphatase)